MMTPTERPVVAGAGCWVYRRTERQLWTVGYYTPEGDWNSDSDHDSAESAAGRVHWLNGGTDVRSSQA